MRRSLQVLMPLILVCLGGYVASAQSYQGGGSFALQCPTSTLWHPAVMLGYDPSSTEDPLGYTGPKVITETVSGVPLTYTAHGGAIKCQQVSGGDGYMTEADGNQTFMFSFGPLSGLNAIANGQPGTQFAVTFNRPYCDPALPNYTNGQPNPNYGSSGCSAGTDPNGAVGYIAPSPAVPNPGADPAAIMNTGVMNGNIPAPLIAFDEDDELFLTLSNVGMIMRPDLFEQHTIHFHGYPNASSFYDGVPDASLAINIGGSFTYYYLAPDAGTYFWHCHITPPEHLQMGMVGQLYVRPRQNRTPVGTDLFTALQEQNGVAPGQKAVDLRTACNPAADILCSAYTPAVNTNAKQGTDLLGNPQKYVYNDGDGSTAYDVEYPLQM